MERLEAATVQHGKIPAAVLVKAMKMLVLLEVQDFIFRIRKVGPSHLFTVAWEQDVHLHI